MESKPLVQQIGNLSQSEPTMPSRRRLLGYKGESQVCKDLQAKGYKVLATNYHSRFGEIDLIMANSVNLIFVEVKTGLFFRDTDEIFTGRQLKRMFTTANFWLATNPKYSEYNLFYIGAVVTGAKIGYIKLA